MKDVKKEREHKGEKERGMEKQLMRNEKKIRKALRSYAQLLTSHLKLRMPQSNLFHLSLPKFAPLSIFLSHVFELERSVNMNGLCIYPHPFLPITNPDNYSFSSPLRFTHIFPSPSPEHQSC